MLLLTFELFQHLSTRVETLVIFPEALITRATEKQRRNTAILIDSDGWESIVQEQNKPTQKEMEGRAINAVSGGLNRFS